MTTTNKDLKVITSYDFISKFYKIKMSEFKMLPSNTLGNYDGFIVKTKAGKSINTSYAHPDDIYELLQEDLKDYVYNFHIEYKRFNLYQKAKKQIRDIAFKQAQQYNYRGFNSERYNKQLNFYDNLVYLENKYGLLHTNVHINFRKKKVAASNFMEILDKHCREYKVDLYEAFLNHMYIVDVICDPYVYNLSDFKHYYDIRKFLNELIIRYGYIKRHSLLP